MNSWRINFNYVWFFCVSLQDKLFSLQGKLFHLSKRKLTAMRPITGTLEIFVSSFNIIKEVCPGILKLSYHTLYIYFNNL